LAALPVGEGPDIYQMHNAKFTPFLEAEIMEPYPDHIFPPNEMDQYMGFKQHHFHGPDGRWYYWPYGLMTSGIFINRTLWEEGGLTDDDIPTTWEELIEVGKKLTKYDAAGRISQAGFNINGYQTILWTDLMYQQGRYLFTKDGKRTQVNIPEGKLAVQFMLDLYEKHKLCDVGFLPWMESFGTGKAAIVYSWGWFGGYMRTNYPDIEWLYGNTPTFTGDLLPAQARNNYEVSQCVNANTSADKKEAAFEFIHWVMSDAEKLVDLALMHDIAPGRMDLFEHPRILEQPMLRKVVKQIPYTIFPGELPSLWEDAVRDFIEEGVFLAGMPIDEALVKGEEAGNAVLAEKDYWIVEHTYVHDDQMLEQD